MDGGNKVNSLQTTPNQGCNLSKSNQQSEQNKGSANKSSRGLPRICHTTRSMVCFRKVTTKSLPFFHYTLYSTLITLHSARLFDPVGHTDNNGLISRRAGVEKICFSTWPKWNGGTETEWSRGQYNPSSRSSNSVHFIFWWITTKLVTNSPLSE